MPKGPAWLWVALVSCIAACGDDDASSPAAGAGGLGAQSGNGGTSAGTGGAGGEGGAAGMGMQAGAGGAAGSSGSGEGGGPASAGAGGTGGNVTAGFDAADHCGPGDYVRAVEFARSSAPNHAQGCTADDYLAAGAAGVFDTMPRVRPGIWSVELGTPMAAGAPYALSLEIELRGLEGAMRFELWATNARCGEQSTAVKLAELPLAPTKQTLCMDVTPSAAYSHVLLVTRDIDDELPSDRQIIVLNGAKFCAAGSCP